MQFKHSITSLKSSAFALLLLAPALHGVQIYTDSTGDVGVNNPPANLDFVSATVSNDATNLTFSLSINADIAGTNWGKYMIAIDTIPGGDMESNGWTRPINDPNGMDFWVGSWVDGGGGVELYSFNGSNWVNIGGATQDLSNAANGQVSYTMPLSSLNLAIGNSFNFDVLSSGGGSTDSAIDSLANPIVTVSDWGIPYSLNPTLSYTVVPEPQTVALLLGLGALGFVAWRRRQA